ncbi:putative FlgM [Desulfamplus magnetovallimortis]|uniref:Negative regulator of flagellin synthesis n=1 Tax=Desulfamplus magnetovallimortis TaxID=1246637 RepID=A0A1W1H9H3_9BACT|nr:flagellar biosynthesis anti-sigma factor FlgM [Desulfamplus magnetovallimortis]SLM29018.1 putative FlgM [Desulfamplus magnetovallimortis]
MKVNYPGSIMIQTAYSNSDVGRSSKNTANQPVARTTGKRDSVTLSNTTRQLQKVASAMDTPRTDRAEKINALKSAIANGEYTVNPDQVAEKLLNTFMG